MSVDWRGRHDLLLPHRGETVVIRFISLILLLAGIAVVGWGGYRLYTDEQGYDAGTQRAESQPFQTSSAGDEDAVESSVEFPSFDEAEGDAFGAAGDDETFGVASTGRVDDMMSRLRTVPIAHETPSEARFNRAFEVTVAIDATGDDTAADALPGDGNIVEGEAQVLEKAQATLTGSAFDIELVSPAIQTISPVTENVWRWRVTPVATGMHELRIELFALENDEALPIRTFTDRVEVRVSRLGQALATADTLDPIFMILGGAGSLLAGLFGVFRFFRGR